jgi:protein-disulfide isomerase
MKIAAALVGISLSLIPNSAWAGRMDVMEGHRASSVRVLIYEDLQCGDCARFQAMFEQKILPKYGSKVAFVHRDFPLAKHDWARSAAVAARWVYEQNKELGIDIRRELLSEQANINPHNLNAWLSEFAGRNHLDQKGIVDSLSDARLNALVDQDRQAAEARGITNTPTVYVGGQAFVETIVYEDLARALDTALAR